MIGPVGNEAMAIDARKHFIVRAARYEERTQGQQYKELAFHGRGEKMWAARRMIPESGVV
jgi:hypothetical protein